MNSEMVSIVMATYNGEEFLHKQLDSILNQTYQHFELIVVDDGSKDKTLSILGEYAATDNRIHVYPAEKNLGVVANFERGIRLAKGEYIALSDQDDIFLPDKIESLVAALSNHPDRDLVISDLALIDEQDVEIATSMWLHSKMKPQEGKPFRSLIYLNFATGCAMMFRRRLLQIALPFPAGCLVHDWWLAVIAASSKGGGICIVNRPLTAYRQHRSNVFGAKAVEYITAKKVIARIKSSPRGLPVIEERMNSMRLQIPRLEAYLQRDCWSTSERLMITNLKKLFEGYLTDVSGSLLSRIPKLFQRVIWAATTRSAIRCIGAAFVTIWPNK